MIKKILCIILISVANFSIAQSNEILFENSEIVVKIIDKEALDCKKSLIEIKRNNHLTDDSSSLVITFSGGDISRIENNLYRINPNCKIGVNSVLIYEKTNEGLKLLGKFNPVIQERKCKIRN